MSGGLTNRCSYFLGPLCISWQYHKAINRLFDVVMSVWPAFYSSRAMTIAVRAASRYCFSGDCKCSYRASYVLLLVTVFHFYPRSVVVSKWTDWFVDNVKLALLMWCRPENWYDCRTGLIGGAAIRQTPSSRPLLHGRLSRPKFVKGQWI